VQSDTKAIVDPDKGFENGAVGSAQDKGSLEATMMPSNVLRKGKKQYSSIPKASLQIDSNR